MSNEEKSYVASFLVKGKLMSRGEYNTLRGWVIPATENPNDLGYLQTSDDGEYLTWTPKEYFEKTHQSVSDGLAFGVAIDLLLGGKYDVMRHLTWDEREHLLVLSASAIQRAMGYGFGEYMGEPAFTKQLCKLTKANTIIMGWMPDITEMSSKSWVLESPKVLIK